jgi:hypothetical protein
MILYKALKILILETCINKFFDNLYFNTKILPKLKQGSDRWVIRWVTSQGDSSYDSTNFVWTSPPGLIGGKNTAFKSYGNINLDNYNITV